jgi:hypothetical protein
MCKTGLNAQTQSEHCQGTVCSPAQATRVFAHLLYAHTHVNVHMQRHPPPLRLNATRCPKLKLH